MSEQQTQVIDAFISYSRRNLDFVQDLTDTLVAVGKALWFDKHKEPLRGIPAGSEWWVEIKRGIEAADNFLFIISSDSVVSPYCNAEIAHALQHGKRKITLMLHNGDESTALTDVTRALNSIPDDAIIPESVSASERSLKTLARRNWQRLSAVQYIAVPGCVDEERQRELITALEQDIAKVRAFSDLQRDAAHWARQERNASFLLRGEALKDAEALLANTPADLEPTSLQLEYVSVSRQHQTRQRRLTAAAITIAAVMLIGAIAAAIVIQTNAARQAAELQQDAAEQQANLQSTAAAEQAIIAATAVAAEDEAQFQRRQAEDALQTARSRQLAAQAELQFAGQLDLGLLLAVEAYRHDDTLEAQGSLVDGLTHARHLTAFLHDFPGRVTATAFSPDGQLLAVGGCAQEEFEVMRPRCQQGVTVIWDVVTLEPVYPPLITHDGRGAVSALAFSPDSNMLAVGGCYQQSDLTPLWCTQNAVVLFDVNTGQPIGEPLLSDKLDPAEDNFNSSNAASQLAFTPDGDSLAVVGGELPGGFNRAITFWDIDTGRRTRESLVPHSDKDKLDTHVEIAFDPAGGTLATTSLFQSSFILWNVETRDPLFDPVVEERAVGWAIAFHPDGTTLATGGPEAAALWDAATGELIRELDDVNELDRVDHLVFTPDGERVLGWSTNSIGVVAWEVESGNDVSVVLEDSIWVTNQVDVSPDGHTFVARDAEGHLSLGDLNDLHPVDETLLELAHASAATLAPNGMVFAAADWGAVIHLADVTSGDVLHELPIGSSAGITDMAFSPDSETLIACNFDWGRNVWLYEVKSGEVIAEGMEGHGNECHAVAFSPTGEVAASASLDGTIILWDPTTGQPLSDPLTDEEAENVSMANGVWSLAFSPDGSVLASGRDDGTILLWDVETQQPLGEPFEAHLGTVGALAYHPGGLVLASGGATGDIRLWSTDDYRSLGPPLAGHQSLVRGLDFGPAGRLASASWDGTLRLWDVTSGQSIGGALVAYPGMLLDSVTFYPDGESLLSNAGEDVLRLDLRPTAWMSRACDIAHRRLTSGEWERFLPGENIQDTCTAFGRPNW